MAATVLVAVGVLVVVDASRGDLVVTDQAPSPGVDDPGPSPAAEELTVPPSVLDPVSRYRWSRVAASDPAVFGEEFEQGISSVTVGGPGLVAVGQADGPAVWTSPDGITWSQPPGNEAAFDIDGGMESVTAGGPGLVAVGVAFDEGGPGEDGAAVWSSVDGLTWSRVPHDEASFGNVTGAWMWDVTAGGPGLVAVGSTTDGAAAWTSVDGISWSRASHDEAAFGGAEMRSVTAGGPGLVAVGGTFDYSIGVVGDAGAAVWTSVDGIVWSRIGNDEEVLRGAGMTDLTAGGPGLVVVGFTTDSAAVWTSVDGIVWSRVPHDDEVFGAQREPVDMRSVVAFDSRPVAVGWSGADGFSDTADAAVWVAELQN